MDTNESESTIEFKLSGSVDMTDIYDFSKAVENLCRDNRKNVVVDFENVSYIDSTGVSLLLKLFRYQKEHGLRLSIVKASSSVASVIRLCSLAEILD